MDDKLVCTMCGGPRSVGRKQCHECYKKAARERSKKRNAMGIRTRYQKTCPVCKEPYTVTRKSSRLCVSCFRKSQRKNKATTDYRFSGKNDYKHRIIAEKTLKRTLTEDENTHHLDGNKSNNKKENLIVLRRADHTRLHRHLEIELAIQQIPPENKEGLASTLRALALSFLLEKEIPFIMVWKYEAPMGKLADPIE